MISASWVSQASKVFVGSVKIEGRRQLAVMNQRAFRVIVKRGNSPDDRMVN